MIETMQTAEWNCTKCGVTNRKLVNRDQAQANDRCVTCHARHRLMRDARPVRWNAVAKT
jgi:DNA-directed RNA polymerase subunit RPC12/RpoP